MEHRDHDRVPRSETFWDQTLARWVDEGQIGSEAEVWALLENDFGSLCWSWPSPFPGRHEIIEENDQTKVIVDQFGQKARHWKTQAGTPEHLGWECTDRDIWENHFKPAMLKTGLHVDLDVIRQRYQRYQAFDLWTFLAGAESFEMTRKMLGDEVSLMAMALEPDWIADISKVHTDLLIRDYQAILDAGIKPDGIWMYGDMAYNHATMCSPAMYRDLIWPDHKRLADFAHANDMKFIFHTDGDVNGIMDLYLEAGFDALQPLEAKANMDIRKLCPSYGDRLCFFGNIDIMIMATNDLEKIEAEVMGKLKAGMAAGSYIYHSDHSVPVSVDWASWRHVIDLINRHGWYQ